MAHSESSRRRGRREREKNTRTKEKERRSRRSSAFDSERRVERSLARAGRGQRVRTLRHERLQRGKERGKERKQ